VRVIHVAPTPFGQGGLLGGGERYPLELARALAAQIDCELITFARQPWQLTESGGLRIRAVRTAGFYHGHPAHPVAPGLPAALARADLIHTHHLRSTPSRVAAVTARLLRKRTAVTDHGLLGGDWRGLLQRLSDRFLAVSRYSARELHSPPAKTRIIYGGADPVRYAPDPGVRRSGVLFVGRITPHKGIDRLIQALPEGATLSIAGSEGHDPNPPERDYPALLRTLSAGKDVRFLGPLGDDALPELIRSAEVLVLPSVHRTVYGRAIAISELLGLVLLEAMASGTPVLASNLGGIPEIVQHGETGYLVEPGSVPELHDRLAELLGNPGLADRMGRAGRALVLDHFTWRACADRCLTAYQELFARRSL
jgi:glycosyltransferase involved in cell wall biosynthesis